MTHRGQSARGSIDWDWRAVGALCLRETKRVMGETWLAEDAAQEATLRAWRQRHSCRTPDRPAPWISAIARRETLRLLTRRHELRYQPDMDPRREPDESSELVDRFDLLQAIRSLDRRDRRLLIGRYWEDLTHRRLARDAGVPESSVSVRLHRLRVRLRRALVEP